MAITYLPLEHHVVRYVPWARLRKDEYENVVGVLGAAFKLRDDEEFLSATWAEFFKGDHSTCVAAAANAIGNSRVDVKPKSGFAIGKVRKIKDCCFADSRQYKIRVIHEPEDDNKAHVAMRRWPRDNDDLLELLAEEAWNSYVLTKDLPQSIKP